MCVCACVCEREREREREREERHSIKVICEEKKISKPSSNPEQRFLPFTVANALNKHINSTLPAMG